MKAIAKIQFLLSRHLAVICIIFLFGVVLGFLVGCKNEHDSSPALSVRINPTEEILPGWSMYFFDFEAGKELELTVIQNELGKEGELLEATGSGHYTLGEKRGSLIVKKASWSNWPDYPEGYPENAPRVEGLARIDDSKSVPFTAHLISHGWPDSHDYDEAVLIIAETGFVEERFEGELHHGRLRERFKEIPERDPEKTP
jgi:hypothetical protein